MILLPRWGLAAEYSFRVLFNTRKSTFYPTLLEGNQEAGQEFF